MACRWRRPRRPRIAQARLARSCLHNPTAAAPAARARDISHVPGRSKDRPVHGSRTSTLGPASGSSALLTDRYELTMLQSTLAGGTASRRCVFEVFARRLPEGRRYGVVAGTGRLLDVLAAFRFGAAELDALRAERVVDEPTLH